MQLNKTSWLILFLLFFSGLGYFREFIFVHYNNVMYQVYYHSDSHLETPGFLQFLFQVPYAKLYYFKYPMTIVFASLFFLLNLWAVKKLSSGALKTKFVFYAYAVLIFIAALSMAYAFFFTKKLADDEYTLSRWLLGVAQSPIICLFLLASEKLISNTQNHD